MFSGRISCIPYKVFIGRHNTFQAYVFSSTFIVANHSFDIDPLVRDDLAAGKYKHKKHPGIFTGNKFLLPERLQNAISLLFEKYPVGNLEKKSQELYTYLWSRALPMTDEEIAKCTEKTAQQIRAKTVAAPLSVDEKKMFDEKIDKRILKEVRKQVNRWKPIQYDARRSILYMASRMAHDYACLYRVFEEIKDQFPDLKPRTLFDFGSGVGSTIWAANTVWPRTLYEHYCVDASADMNTLARLLLQDGQEDKETIFKEVYFRQYFPPSVQNRYDLVVDAFTLLELPSQAERLKFVLGLWRKTEQFLILVENGTNAGFRAIIEARDFILQLGSESSANEESQAEFEGHVVAPCPHEKQCPRFVRNDGTPCNFQINFQHLNELKAGNDLKTALFSYVVLKKCKRDQMQAGGAWPRIVRESCKASKRVHLPICSADGQLQQTVITAKKHGKDLYWCARACRWGDRLPALPRDTEDKKLTMEIAEKEDNNGGADGLAQEELNNLEEEKLSNVDVERKRLFDVLTNIHSGKCSQSDGTMKILS